MIPKKIELFLHTKKHIQTDTRPLEHIKEVRNRRSIGGYNEQLITSIHKWLSDDEVKVKKLIEDFAKHQGLKLVIYDKASFWDNIHAKLKGIKITPTVIYGKHVFTGVITLDQLQKIS